MSGSITPGLSLMGDPMGLAEYAATSQMDPVHKQLQAVGIPTTPSQPQAPAPDISQTGSVGPDGSYVPPAAIPTPQQAQSANPLGAVANAVVPAAMAGGDHPAPAPVQSNAPSPDQQISTQDGNQLYSRGKQALETVNAQQQAADASWGGALSDAKKAEQAQQQAPTMAPSAALAAAPNGDSFDLYGYGQQGQAPAKPVATLPATPSTGADGRDFSQPQHLNADGTRNWDTVVNQITSMNSPTSKNGAGSTASGQGDFTDGTWQQFLQSPANTGKWTMQDKSNPAAVDAAVRWNAGVTNNALKAGIGRDATDTEVLAGHLLGAGYLTSALKNPTGDAYQTYVAAAGQGRADQAFSQNGTLLQKGMTNAQAVQTAENFMTGHGAPGHGAPDVTLAATSAQPSAQPATSADQRLALAQSLQGGGGNNDIASQLRAVGLNPNTMMGNPFLALGAGLAGKRTLGEGISAAAGNLNQLYMQRGDLGFKLAQMGLENKRLDNQAAYQRELLDYRGVGLGKTVGAPFKLEAGNPALPPGSPPGWYQHDGAGRLVPSGAPASNVNASPELKGDQAFSSTQARSGAEDLKQLQEGSQTDALARENLTGAIQELQRNPGIFGPSVKSTVQRQLAMWGLGGADEIQAFQKMSADQRAKYLEQASGGHEGTMLRSTASQKMFSQAVADASTDPHAAQYVFDTQLAMVNARDALREAVSSGAVPRDANFSQHESDFYTNYLKAHPLPIFTPGYTSQLVGAPGAQAAPTQTASSSSAPAISSFWTK
jgi:hypothetical protein